MSKKGGKAMITDVIPYGGQVHKARPHPPFSGPGNDIVSTTALTCRRGAHHPLHHRSGHAARLPPFPRSSSPPTPALAEKKPHWIDFDAERLLREEQAVVVEDFIDMMREIAGGKTL
ncbi:MAG: hypothetical protein ACOX0D_10140 [Sphaerochaeta sp.]